MRSLTSIAVVLLAVSLAAAAPLQQTAMAEAKGQGMQMTAMADEGSDTIMITGTIVKTLPTDITFTVTSPDGLKVVDVDQIRPVDGSFATEFIISPMWSDDGIYTIKATSGISGTSLYTIELPVMVVGGMAQGTMIMDGNLHESIVYDESKGNIPEPTGITLEATGEIGSNVITVTGTTDIAIEDITLTVTAPNDNRVTVAQITPNTDGTYTKDIITGGELWTEDGLYTVTVHQNDDPMYTASAVVDIEDGLVVPEFGVIAVMILAVAIVSVIAISSRSRLGIVTGQ